MVRIDQSAFNKTGSNIIPDKKWESDKGSGRKGTHEKSFNWNSIVGSLSGGSIAIVRELTLFGYIEEETQIYTRVDAE